MRQNLKEVNYIIQGHATNTSQGHIQIQLCLMPRSLLLATTICCLLREVMLGHKWIRRKFRTILNLGCRIPRKLETKGGSRSGTCRKRCPSWGQDLFSAPACAYSTGNFPILFFLLFSLFLNMRQKPQILVIKIVYPKILNVAKTIFIGQCNRKISSDL